MRGLVVLTALMMCGSAAAQTPVEPGEDLASAKSSAGAIVCAKDERECFKRVGGAAERRGNVLIIRLTNGPTKEFETTEQACRDNVWEKCLNYRLAGYYPAHRHFLLYVGFVNHGGTFLIISGRTGHQTRILDVPHYSPDGKRFAAVTGSEADDANGIEIWSTSEPPKAEFQHSPKGYALYEFDRWDGNDRLR